MLSFPAKKLTFGFVWSSLAVLSLMKAAGADGVQSLQRVSGAIPEYPAVAARYDIRGRVVARLYIDQNGRVVNCEIVSSPADILSETVINGVKDWQFTKPTGATAPVAKLMAFPFTLVGSSAGSDMNDEAPRGLLEYPLNAEQLGAEVESGWADVKVRINKDGFVDVMPNGRLDFYVMKTSGERMRMSILNILEKLRFEKAIDGLSEAKSKASNQLKIVVDESLNIHVTNVSAPAAL